MDGPRSWKRCTACTDKTPTATATLPATSTGQRRAGGGRLKRGTTSRSATSTAAAAIVATSQPASTSESQWIPMNARL